MKSENLKLVNLAYLVELVFSQKVLYIGDIFVVPDFDNPGKSQSPARPITAAFRYLGCSDLKYVYIAESYGNEIELLRTFSPFYRL